MVTRRAPRSFLATAIVAALLGLVVMAFTAACGGDDDGGEGQVATESAAGPGPTVTRPEPAGEPRTFRMGFSSLPPEQTTEAYIQAVATAAQYGELLLVQRTPPWEDFLPGSSISDNTANVTRLELDLLDQYEHLELFYAVDPTDGAVQRTRLANLPADVDATAGFLDEGARQAFVAYTTYVATNYKPAYLALGVEVNMLRDRAPEQYEAFLSLYAEAYDAAKAASPETKVFPTFQLEDLEGTLDKVHPPQWEVLADFNGRMDALALSSYPFLANVRNAGDVRPDYYTQLKSRWGGEILIAETGYSSDPVEGLSLTGSQADQDAFLQRVLADAETNGFSAVVWFAALDPVFTEGPNAVLKDIGLRESDGANKVAWTTWEEAVRRPLEAGE